jgi:hypothetical protein
MTNPALKHSENTTDLKVNRLNSIEKAEKFAKIFTEELSIRLGKKITYKQKDKDIPNYIIKEDGWFGSEYCQILFSDRVAPVAILAKKPSESDKSGIEKFDKILSNITIVINTINQKVKSSSDGILFDLRTEGKPYLNITKWKIDEFISNLILSLSKINNENPKIYSQVDGQSSSNSIVIIIKKNNNPYVRVSFNLTSSIKHSYHDVSDQISVNEDVTIEVYLMEAPTGIMLEEFKTKGKLFNDLNLFAQTQIFKYHEANNKKVVVKLDFNKK